VCSRWPEKEACGQECLAQIQEAPKACLVWTIINQWYQGQNCAYGHEPFGETHWHDHPPALLDNDLKTVQWDSRRKTPGSAEHPLACLLELPHCRIHSPRASRIGG